jgi:hypothetical protein
VFAVVIQITDTADYRIMHIDPASGLPIYTANSSFVTATACFENTVQINNIGFHGPFVPLEKGKDVFRILVIGSSYIEARQVPVVEMYSTLLQNRLNTDPNRTYTYEVIPMGVNTNRLLTSALYYVKYGSALHPDLVIAFESQYELENLFGTPSTDAQGNILLQMPKARIQNPTEAFLRDQLHQFKLLVNIYNRYLVFRDDVASFFAHPFPFIPQSVTAPSAAELAAQDATRWQEQRAVLRALAVRVHSDQAQLLVASWLMPGASTSTMEEFPINLAGIAARNDIFYTNLAPAFSAEEAASGTPAIRMSCDMHWTPAGHQYMADAFYQYLSSHPTLLER